MFKIVDYPENKLFMNMYCMRQIISSSCATDNQIPLELHVLWWFCICVYERIEWGKLSPYLISYIIYNYCIKVNDMAHSVYYCCFLTYHCHILKHFPFYFRLTSSSVDLTFWPPLSVEQWTLIMLNIPSCSSFQC